MNKKITFVIIGILVVILLVVAYLIFVGKNNGAPTSNNIGQKFSDSPLYKHAYLINVDNYDAQTQQALSGFKVEKTNLKDGSQQITLNAQVAEYKTQTYIVKPGQKLYFIEKFLGDDSNSQEYSLGDDSAVLVDADGYIIK